MKKSIVFLFLIASIMANANVRMPLLFSDGMVLQRNKAIPVWGWAGANEKIAVHFNKQTKTIKADATGKWMIELDSEIAGGPYLLSVKGKNIITIKDVLVGEVWICSGQSNMEFQMYKTLNFENEIKDSDYPMIRHFDVALDLSGSPKKELKAGKWTVSSKETVKDFTAIGFFFAKKLYAELKIPIGIINTSWGGTCVETWTSRQAFEKSEDFKDMIAEIPQVNMDAVFETYKKSLFDNIKKIQGFEVSMIDENQFKELNFQDSKWPEIKVPSLWENQQIGNIDGIVWMRKTITITAEQAKKKPFCICQKEMTKM